MIGGGSRSTTPVSLGSRKSPTNDQSVQAGGPNKKEDKKVIKPGQSNVQRQNNQRRNSREMKDNRSGGEAQENQSRPQNRQPVPRNQYNQGYQGQGYQGQGYQGQGYQGQGYHGHSYQGHHEYQQHNQANASQNNQQQRQSWGGRGPMRQRGRPRGTFRPNQSGQPNQGNKRNTLKFDNDYDFEQANTEFEELRNQLAKVKIDEGTSTTCTTKPEVNGDVDKKDDSGNETGAGETEQEEEHEVFYDKTKSFFDKISCEAVERAKGKSQRTDWRTERKLNSETFGVSATRRGNFRGRGGFRGGMGFRGGYRGNYRTPQRRDQQQGNQMEKNPQTSYNRSSSNQKPPEPLRAVLKPTLPMPAMAAK